MKSDLMSKLSACLFVLVMALSTLVVLPAAVEGQAPGTNDILVPVLGQSSQAVPSATVILTNVHSGQTIQATHVGGTSLFFRAQAAPSGFYRLDVTAGGYYDSLNADFFRFDGLAPFSTDPVQLDAFPTKIYTWTITTSPVKSGVSIGFYDADRRQIVASGTSNISGKAVVSMFDTASLGTFYLFAEGAGLETYLETVTVTSSNNTATVPLTDSTQVVGFVNTDAGTGQHVVAYLLNQDPSIPWIKRLLKSDATFGSFTFDAYPGTYTLSVRADDARSNVTTGFVVGSTTILTMTLSSQTPREERSSIVFDANYRSFNLSLSTTWAYDEPFPGLQYSDVGSLRMQIDMNNNSDGTVDALEDAKFRNDPSAGSGMMLFGPKNVTTPWLLSVNKTATSPGVFYVSSPNLVNFNLGSTVGPVDSLASVAYSYKATYTVTVPSGVEAPPVTSPEYTLAVNVFHDTSFVDYVFTVKLMPDFELVPPNSTSDTTTFVGGFQNFTIDPSTGSGPISVSLLVEKALQPVAAGGLDTSATVSVLKNATGVVVRYYVAVDKNTTFTANSSSDPNGNPLTYIWEFGDGNTATTMNKTIVHVYAFATNTTANLTVEDVSGRTNNTQINVTVDGLDPTPVISLRNRSLIGGELHLNQSETFIIHGMESFDDAVSESDREGRIAYYQFSWGDGNVSGRIMLTDDQKNATWSYERAGTYTLWLNVTDVTGHHKNASRTVRVNDTTAPVVSFKVMNASWGTSLVEQQELHFDASATRDNVDNYTLMHYSWYFADGTGASSYRNGTGLYNVTHTYSKLGSYSVTLNVTDLADPEGNYHKLAKGITVASKPRPNLKIDNATYQPGEFTEGKSGFIVVNITNVGNAIARNITVNFYIQNLDGTQTLIRSATASEIFNGSNQASTVAPQGKIQVRFAYTPSGKGTFTIKVSVNATDQLTASELVLSGPNALVVNEAAWKAYALWGGVIGVIILVPLLLFLSRRWSRRERKGPRREKKSEEKEE
jgi:hypothetical protein